MASGPTWNSHRGTWYVQYWRDGKWQRKTAAKATKWKPGDPEPASIPHEAYATLADCKKIEKESRERGPSLIPPLLKDFLAEHLGRYGNQETKETVEKTYEQFLEWCKGCGVTRFDQVNSRVCEKWIDQVAPTFAINTVIRKRAQLSAAWGHFFKKKEIPANPWTGVKAKGLEITKERKAWSKKQFDQLLTRANPWLQDVLILGVNTGLRIGAIMNIEWRDWLRDEDGLPSLGIIRVRREIDKGQVGYRVPVSRQLHEVLVRRFASKKNKFIITGMRGKQLSDRNITRRAICTACENAGLEIPQSPNHHMRRTFGRWAHYGHLNGISIPIYVISKWFGHKSIKTTQVYLELEDEDSTKFMVPDDD